MKKIKLKPIRQNNKFYCPKCNTCLDAKICKHFKKE